MAKSVAYIRYNGPLNSVVIEGLGHFSPGEVKQADYLTAASFRDDANAKAEGWEVSDTPFDAPTQNKAANTAKVVAKPTAVHSDSVAPKV